jgi:hypothetical protein
MASLGWDSKCRVLSIGKLDFPYEGDSRVYIKLSGNCVYKDPSCPFSNNLQGKIKLLCALNLTKWLSSTRCVCKYTKQEINMQYKINMQMQQHQKIYCRENMETKVICNAMINYKRYICSVLVCEMQ